MRTTLLIIEESLLERARALTGIQENSAVVRAGLEALIACEAGKRLAERGQRGNVARAKRLLRRAGRGKPPVPADELL